MKKKFLGLMTRCKDEFYIKEFIDYYLSQGVNHIIILDDNSEDKSIYDNIDEKRVEIIYCDFGQDKRNYPNQFYKKIRLNFEWLIYVDVDEFITTKKNLSNTIREELETTFKDVDCIKIPWVMMACNNRKKNPEKILFEIIHRMNQDKRHHTNHKEKEKCMKFKCKFDSIEVKCIFKPEKFLSLWDHYPYEKVNQDCTVVNSIDLNSEKLENINYSNLREQGIKNGFLLCYHYRLISQENTLNKMKNNIWYKKFTLDDIMRNDYPEIIDYTIKNKTSKFNKVFILGFNKKTSIILHNFFLKNKIKSMTFNSNNLLELFDKNIKLGKKLFEGVKIKDKNNLNFKFENTCLFSDIPLIKKKNLEYYQLLDKQYPNSKFIINLVNESKLSRQRIKENCTEFTLNKVENISSWIRMYHQKIKQVRNYFKIRKNKEKLCIFDIEKDSITKIINFLEYDYQLDKSLFDTSISYQNITSD